MRRITVFSWSLLDMSVSRVIRAKPSGVERAFREPTWVLVEDSTVEMSMIRLMRSLATTCRVVRKVPSTSSAQDTLIQRPFSLGLRRAGSALGQSLRWTDTP